MIPALPRTDDERAPQLQEPLRQEDALGAEVERSVTHVGVSILLTALGFVSAVVALLVERWTGAGEPVDRTQLAIACLLAAVVIGGVLGGIGQLLQIRAELRARRQSGRDVALRSPPERTGVADLDSFRKRPGVVIRDESSDESLRRGARHHVGPH